MKLAVIFTGGTIGSQIQENGYINSAKETNYYLLEQYRNHFGKGVSFETYEPYHILSENLQADNLSLLIQTIKNIIMKDYSPSINTTNPETDGNIQGIIITHGTDSLAYTASILQYIFSYSQIPIILVSSDYVLTDQRANGLTNFCHAVNFIRQTLKSSNHVNETLSYSASVCGVFVSYCNQGGIPTIHRGTRLQNVITYSADVYSILDSWYGKFEHDRFILNPNYNIKDKNKSPFIENPELTTNTESIVCLKAAPGLTYPLLTKQHKAVLFEGYHSGTIPLDENLKKFALTAASLHIPIYLTGLTEEADHYETVKQYLQLGICPLVNRSTISQYCKLWLAISNHMDLDTVMNVSIAEDWC